MISIFLISRDTYIPLEPRQRVCGSLRRVSSIYIIYLYITLYTILYFQNMAIFNNELHPSTHYIKTTPKTEMYYIWLCRPMMYNNQSWRNYLSIFLQTSWGRYKINNKSTCYDKLLTNYKKSMIIYGTKKKKKKNFTNFWNRNRLQLFINSYVFSWWRLVYYNTKKQKKHQFLNHP